MHWLFNDLSFTGQYPDVETFCRELGKILRLRASSHAVRERLLCSRRLHEQLVTPSTSFHEAIYSNYDRNFKSQVMRWVVNHGPFWDDDREPQQDDYFEYEEQDVTNQGLGEAARRKLSDKPVGTYSIVGGRYCFALTPLFVQHGLSEDRLGDPIEIPNIYELQELRHAAENVVSFRNWNEFLVYCRKSFTQLDILDTVDAPLRQSPFSRAVAERLIELLEILVEVGTSRNKKGEYTDTTNELIKKHFQGETARFSDESASNKNKFKNKLTFTDKQANQSLFCPWHGKVRTQQFRIHFPWPLKPSDTSLKIVYIGPKITKK